MGFETRKLNHEEENYHSLMGPFFGNRQAANEIGMPIYNDAYKTFYGGFFHGELVGILSIDYTKSIASITDCYIRKSWRGNGFLMRMLEFSLDDSCIYTANCNVNSLSSFIKLGFKETSKTKNYTRVIRNAKN